MCYINVVLVILIWAALYRSNCGTDILSSALLCDEKLKFGGPTHQGMEGKTERREVSYLCIVIKREELRNVHQCWFLDRVPGKFQERFVAHFRRKTYAPMAPNLIEILLGKKIKHYAFSLVYISTCLHITYWNHRSGGVCRPGNSNIFCFISWPTNATHSSFSSMKHNYCVYFILPATMCIIHLLNPYFSSIDSIHGWKIQP